MQRSDFSWNEYCKSREQVNWWYDNPDCEVVFCSYISEQIVQLTLKSRKEKIKPSRQSHIVNGKDKVYLLICCCCQNDNFCCCRSLNNLLGSGWIGQGELKIVREWAQERLTECFSFFRLFVSCWRKREQR